MKWWQGFGLSLLVALGLHAVVLLAPLVAERGDTAAPTIEVSLFSLPAGTGTEDRQPAAAGSGGGGPAPTPAVPAAAAPPPAPAAPSAAPAPVPDSLLPVQAAGQASESSRAGTAEASLPAASTDGSSSGGSGTGADTGAPSSGGGAGGTGGPSGGLGGPAGGSGSDGAAVSMPQPRIEVLPEYPRGARKAGWEGVVTIGVTIDESGKVVSAEILASSGHASLDQAALDALRRTTYYPVFREGKPVPARFKRPYRFTLN